MRGLQNKNGAPLFTSFPEFNDVCCYTKTLVTLDTLHIINSAKTVQLKLHAHILMPFSLSTVLLEIHNAGTCRIGINFLVYFISSTIFTFSDLIFKGNRVGLMSQLLLFQEFLCSFPKRPMLNQHKEQMNNPDFEEIPPIKLPLVGWPPQDQLPKLVPALILQGYSRLLIFLQHLSSPKLTPELPSCRTFASHVP